MALWIMSVKIVYTVVAVSLSELSAPCLARNRSVQRSSSESETSDRSFNLLKELQNVRELILSHTRLALEHVHVTAVDEPFYYSTD